MTRDTVNNEGRPGSKWRILAWGLGAALVLAPLLAMQVTDQVVWGPADFAIAAALVGGVGLAFDVAVRMTRNSAYRAGLGIALTAAFLLIWINLAVGIIGSEDNPANWMYAGVLAVGATGAFVGRFESRGMARAMFAAAFSQLLVAAIALSTGLGFTGPITIAFTALWLLSAVLFRKAARDQGQASGAS
jgi:hypothetical protein